MRIENERLAAQPDHIGRRIASQSLSPGALPGVCPITDHEPGLSKEFIGVMLISNHAIVRAAVRLLIERDPEMKVVCEAGIDVGGLAGCPEAPDIVLIDLDSSSEPAADFLPKLLRNVQGASVLILAGSPSWEEHHSVVRLGVKGMVSKEKPPDVLIMAIRKVYAGEMWLDRSVLAKLLQEMSSAEHSPERDYEAVKIAALTKREREVIALFGSGFDGKRVAERLFIAETTVRHHLTSIFDKLEVRDRFELVFYAYRNGLARPPV